jgi:hypothetical protein
MLEMETAHGSPLLGHREVDLRNGDVGIRSRKFLSAIKAFQEAPVIANGLALKDVKSRNSCFDNVKPIAHVRSTDS